MNKIIVTNPSEGYRQIDTFESTSFEQIDDKVAQAKKYFLSWSQKSLQNRIYLLRLLLNKCIEHKDELADLIAREMGMPLSVCHDIDIDPGITFIEGYLKHAQEWLSSEVLYESATEIHHLFYEPLGVVAAIVPWNYPFSNFIWAVIPHLLVGNTLVIKHSEHSILVTKYLEQLFIEVGLENVCYFVYGKGADVGNHLIHTSVDMLWFIGSTQTGKVIYQAAAKQMIPAILELGGSAAGIVCQDADIDKAVESAFFYRFINSGQTCDGLKRLLLHQSIYDEFLEKLVDYIRQQPVGSALDRSSKIGPLVNQTQVETYQFQLDNALKNGAQVAYQANVSKSLRGAYVAPTILTNIRHDMSVWREEVFAPLLPVVSFSLVEEAIELANNTRMA